MNATKASIEQQFEVQTELGVQGNVARVRFLLNDEYVGSITAVKSHDDTFAVRYSDCTIRGYGKLLYYYLLDIIYPNWLSPDGCVTEYAARVWNGVYRTCEKVPSSEIHLLDTSDTYLGYKARFKFK